MSLYLCSTSEFKQSLLKRLGVTFNTLDPQVDESPIPSETPLQRALRLAEAKSQAGAQDCFSDPEAHPTPKTLYFIGADQVITLGHNPNSHCYSKPRSVQNAITQLKELQGKTHFLHCAVSLTYGTPQASQTLTEVVTYLMQMRPLTHQQIQSYVAQDNPIYCAGAYKIESKGIRLFSAMHGSDETAIVGLPLTKTQSLLEKAGFPMPNFQK